jgi:hypothetical protein
VFEKRVPRRIFAPKRDKMIGGYKKLLSEEFHKFILCAKYRLPKSRSKT